MKRSILFVSALLAIAPVAAQTVTTIGGTGSSPTRSNLGKGNAIRIDSSVVLLNFEMYLDVPGPETLTFYVYQHHSPGGTFNLQNSWSVNVNGTGVGPAWYSSGFTPTNLLCGNSYILGVSWPGTATYHYSIGTCGDPIALGAWLSGSTTSNPTPPTEFVGCDRAMYHQRFTTVPLTSVGCVGTGCNSSGTAPRLLASSAPEIGTTLDIELVDGTGNTPAMYLFVPQPTVATPTRLFGCDIWVDLIFLPVGLTHVANLSPAGEGLVSIPIPSNPAFVGTQLSVQAGVLTTPLAISNAIDLTVF